MEMKKAKEGRKKRSHRALLRVSETERVGGLTTFSGVAGDPASAPTTAARTVLTRLKSKDTADQSRQPACGWLVYSWAALF